MCLLLCFECDFVIEIDTFLFSNIYFRRVDRGKLNFGILIFRFSFCRKMLCRGCRVFNGLKSFEYFVVLSFDRDRLVSTIVSHSKLLFSERLKYLQCEHRLQNSVDLLERFQKMKFEVETLNKKQASNAIV